MIFNHPDYIVMLAAVNNGMAVEGTKVDGGSGVANGASVKGKQPRKKQVVKCSNPACLATKVNDDGTEWKKCKGRV